MQFDNQLIYLYLVAYKKLWYLYHSFRLTLCCKWGFLVTQIVKNLPATQETWIQSLVRKVPWRRKWQPTPVFLLGEFHGLRSLASYGSRGSQEFYMCYKQIDHLGVFVLKPKPKWCKYEDWRYSKNQAEIIIYLTLDCYLKIRSRQAHKASYRGKSLYNGHKFSRDDVQWAEEGFDFAHFGKDKD